MNLLRIAAALFALAGPADAAHLVLMPCAPMLHARNEHAAVLLPTGRVLVVGGSVLRGESAIPWAELFDPGTRTFSETGALHIPRVDPLAVATRDGRVLVAGGWTRSYVIATATAEIWDPTSSAFRLVAPMTVPRGVGADVLELATGGVLIIGGTRDGEMGASTDVIDIFDPGTEEFHQWGTLGMSRTSACLEREGPRRFRLRAGNFSCCNATASSARMLHDDECDLDQHGCKLVPPEGPDMTGALFNWMEADAYFDQAGALGRGLQIVPCDDVLVREDARLRVANSLVRGLKADLIHPSPLPGARKGTILTALPDGCVLATGGIDADLRALADAALICVVEDSVK